MKRWCKCGDTISTVWPLSEYDGVRPNLHLNATCDTPESCAYANELIVAGRWRVSRCGTCGHEVGLDNRCTCPTLPLA